MKTKTQIPINTIDQLEKNLFIFLESNKVDDDFYMDLAKKIVTQYEDGSDRLIDLICDVDTLRLRASIFALSNYSPKSIELTDMLLEYIHDSREMIVSEALDGLIEVGSADLADQVQKLFSHESPYVRGAVVRFIARKLPLEDSREFLVEAINDSHNIVIQNVIDELGDLGQKDMLPLVSQFLEHPCIDVQEAAKDAIESLSLE